MDSTLFRRPLLNQNLIATGIDFALLIFGSFNTGGLKREGSYGQRNRTLFLVLIIVLTPDHARLLSVEGTGAQTDEKTSIVETREWISGRICAAAEREIWWRQKLGSPAHP